MGAAQTSYVASGATSSTGPPKASFASASSSCASNHAGTWVISRRPTPAAAACSPACRPERWMPGGAGVGEAAAAVLHPHRVGLAGVVDRRGPHDDARHLHATAVGERVEGEDVGHVGLGALRRAGGVRGGE